MLRDDPLPGQHRDRAIVVGHDGSPGATRALWWAASTLPADGRLVVVHAEHPAAPAPALARCRSRIDAALRQDDDGALDGVVLEVRHIGGLPADALRDAADDVGADSIIVGRHHAGSYAGTTVRHLLDVTDRPVTVGPR
jgi:nucleotide-binding universal stress UspA family protein